MKKGQQFLCGHGPDERGTPYGECPLCQEDTRRKIDSWLASKEVQEKSARANAHSRRAQMEMTLPEEDFIPQVEGMASDFSMIVFGPPKVGKTSFGASFPKSILLECEPGGAKYIKCRKLDINSLAELRDAWNLLSKDTNYETVILDSLDRVSMLIEDEICKEMGLKNIMEAKKGERNGAQWGYYSQRVLSFLEGWKLLGKRIIFLAHTKKAETDGNGICISPKTINLYGQAATRVMSIVENIGHLYAEDDGNGNVVRYLSFRSGNNVEAGSRHPALTDKKIVLPKDNPYGAFEALFGKVEEKKKSKKELAEVK